LMILLQNPNMPVPTNAVEIDAAILDIKAHLETGLTWLTNGYGRTYKNLDARNGTTVFYPEVYLGEQNNSHRYINISPDNDKQGQCFFYVVKETISQFQPGMYSFLSYDTAIIFSVNMELINNTVLQTEIFQQNLVAQVRDVLTRQLMGAAYQLTISSVDFLFENVYSEFDLADAQQLEKAPLSHFRFNCTIKLPETCPVPSIAPPITTCYSLLFDGVNESINCTDNVAFDLERNDSFSISTWIKIESYPLLLSPVVSKFDRAIRRGILLGIEPAGTVRFILAHDTTSPANYIFARTNISLLTEEWYNIIVTYNGSSDISGVKIYIDGQIVNFATIGNNLSATILNLENLNISNLDNLFFFNGNIANARIWNTELTSIQVSEEHNLGTILSPAVQQGNLIVNTDINNATFGTEWNIPDLTEITAGYTSVNMEVEDKVGECPIPVIPCYSLLFDGVIEYVNCTDNVAFNFERTDSVTLSAWVKFENIVSTQLFVSKYDTSINRGYYLALIGGKIKLSLQSNGGTVAATVETINSVNINQWYNITATFDGSSTAAGCNIYVDGVSVATTIVHDTLSATIINAVTFNIGATFGALFGLDGNIAKARTWNTELTSIQAAAEYNGGTILSPAVQGANLVIDTDINNATFGTQWSIPDLTGITVGYQSLNMEVEDKVADCPS
jgi:hypothetical protein